jgi:hypothetical protein
MLNIPHTPAQPLDNGANPRQYLLIYILQKIIVVVFVGVATLGARKGKNFQICLANDSVAAAAAAVAWHYYCY